MNETDSFVQDLSHWSNAIFHKWYVTLWLDDVATGDIASVWEPAKRVGPCADGWDTEMYKIMYVYL